MPTYEYKCEECGELVETFQKMSDEPLKICPKCGGHLRRLIFGGTGLIFKGSGWYITDYARKNSVTSPKKCDSKTETPTTPDAKIITKKE
jgi:putative FmdB family regulatory protein